MTKTVKFDENGRRSEIELQMHQLNTQGSILIAKWDPENGIKQVPGGTSTPAESDPSVVSLRNRTFIVLIALVIINNIFENRMENCSCIFFRLILTE